MTTLTGLYLVGLSLFLAFLVLYQHARGTYPFMSIRNVTILGFIVFQTFSVAQRIISDDFGNMPLQDPQSTGMTFAAMSTAFIVFFLLFAQWGVGARFLARRFPVSTFQPSPGTLILIAIITGGMGVFLRFGVAIPFVSILTNYFGQGFAVVSVGIMAWVWARHLFNPLVIALMLVCLLGNSLTILTGAFGRRGLVAVAGALVWGMYFSQWRLLPTTKLLTRLALISIGPVLLVALFTAARSAGEKDRGAGEQLTAMRRSSVTQGLSILTEGQAGRISLWLIENHPDPHSYRWFFTPRYFFMLPVPRDWWDGKPEPLSTLVPVMANVPNVNQERLTLSPGIIGSAAAEGGWPAVILYGIIGGLFVRFFDELIIRNASSPLLVLPIGSALGHGLGLARGETSAFAFNFVITIAGTYVFMVLLAKMLESRASSMAMFAGLHHDASLASAEEDEPWHADGHADELSYDEHEHSTY